jgi:hypothetical protein
VAFAGAGVAQQDDRGAGVDERAVVERSDGDGWDAGGGGVELVQPLGSWELGLEQAAGLAAGGALVDLGGQHLGQECPVGQALAGGVVGDAGVLGGDGGQVQLTAGDPDRRLGGLFGHGLHALTSSQARPSRWS